VSDLKPIRVQSKFFFEGTQKFYLQGVTYGPFRPAEPGGWGYTTPDKTARDFDLIAAAGFNTLRVYHPPPKWLLDLAAGRGLRLLVTVPWKRRVLFLDSTEVQREIQGSVRDAARESAGHPGILGFYVDNEIPADLVRWYGPEPVQNFLDSLVRIVKEENPDALAAYANFPPTEYLLPKAVDFYSYNVYLHDPKRLAAYCARLHNLAEEKPLVLGEFGMDTIRHPMEEQAQLLEDHFDVVFRGGLAGTIIFAWTDEWFTGGHDMDKDWNFGLVNGAREPKPSYHRLAGKTIRPGESVPKKYPLKKWPRVSVVVCSYNGGATLRECMEALMHVDYPDFEVVLVDDGSTDKTQEIMKDFPTVRNIYQKNAGLSHARNVGIEAATGEIVAFTDSDCMADPDWLYHLVNVMLEEGFVSVGGPNISPPAKNWVGAAVAAAPGAPSHVLLTDARPSTSPGATWRSSNGRSRRSADSTRNTARPATMWISAGGSCRTGTRSASALRRSSGTTAVSRSKPSSNSRAATARRSRSCASSTSTTSTTRARPAGMA